MENSVIELGIFIERHKRDRLTRQSPKNLPFYNTVTNDHNTQSESDHFQDTKALSLHSNGAIDLRNESKFDENENLSMGKIEDLWKGIRSCMPGVSFHDEIVDSEAKIAPCSLAPEIVDDVLNRSWYLEKRKKEKKCLSLDCTLFLSQYISSNLFHFRN